MKKILEYIQAHPLMVVFCFITLGLLPVLAMRDLSPSNELRYLSIADEALRDGHFFAFFNQGVAYADKPPLYFWLIMLCKVIFGKHLMLALTMFSFIPALVIIKVMDSLAGPSKTGEKTAMALILGTSFMFLGMSIFLRMDMLMCMFIVLAINSFYRWYKGIGNARTQSFLMPVWIFMALFTKGPVGLLVPPVSIAIFLAVKGEWKSIGKYLGFKTWGIILALCLLWFGGVYMDGGPEYLNNLLFHQTIDRAHNAFHHKQPFWYYFAIIWFTLAPYCLLTVGTLITSAACGGLLPEHRGKLAGKYLRAGDLEILFTVIAVTTILMLSAFSSKLAIYLAPAFPFIVYLLPLTVDRTGWKKWMDWAMGIPAGIIALAGTAALCALTLFRNTDMVASLVSEMGFITKPAILLALVIITTGSILSLIWVVKGKSWSMRVFFLTSSLIMGVYAGSAYMPEINDYIGYGNVCDLVEDGTDVCTLYVRRPENMDVYLGRDILDFGKEPGKFIGFATGTDHSLTLIIKTDKISRSPELEEVLSKADKVACGPYTVATIRHNQLSD